MTNLEQIIENTKKINMGGKDYLSLMLEQRVEGPTNAGSSYKVESAEELLKMLQRVHWIETSHPDVAPGCQAYEAHLPGLLGIFPIDSLPVDVELFAIDPKGTGKVSIGAANIPKEHVDFSFLIIGKEEIDGEQLDVIFTFHPGEPVPPSIIETKKNCRRNVADESTGTGARI